MQFPNAGKHPLFWQASEHINLFSIINDWDSFSQGRNRANKEPYIYVYFFFFSMNFWAKTVDAWISVAAGDFIVSALNYW